MADIPKDQLAKKVADLQAKLASMLVDLKELEGVKLEKGQKVDISPTVGVWEISYKT